VAEPYQFLSGKSEHNGNMFTAEVLKIDDQKTIGGSAFAPGIPEGRSTLGISEVGSVSFSHLTVHLGVRILPRTVRWQVANMSYKPDANDASVKLNERSQQAPYSQGDL
jgi:hypothetical protein